MANNKNGLLVILIILCFIFSPIFQFLPRLLTCSLKGAEKIEKVTKNLQRN
jgi:hypothetical protein